MEEQEKTVECANQGNGTSEQRPGETALFGLIGEDLRQHTLSSGVETGIKVYQLNNLHFPAALQSIKGLWEMSLPLNHK